MDVKRFRADLYGLAVRATVGEDEEFRSKVFDIANILVGLYKKNLVKINHSALELVCAKDLIKQGYDVKVEYKLDRSLVCDVMGTSDEGPLIVEIETGFIPPEAALRPSVYARSRIASKIARYSKFAGRFALGTTASYVLDFPRFFVKPTGKRTAKEAGEIKGLTDIYYNNPQISIADLMFAKLHSVMIVDVDSATTKVVDPEAYAEAASAFTRRNHAAQALNRNRLERKRGFNFGEATA